MDSLSMVLLLIVAFVGWSQGITWLFLGSLILLMVTARSIGVMCLVLGGLFAVYFLKLGQYWYVVLILMALIIVLTKGRKEKGGYGSEMYSPEMMQQLLGGQGGYQ